LYYLMMASLLCFFVSEYAPSPLKPPALSPPPNWKSWAVRFGVSLLVHTSILWFTLGFWGLLLAAALLVFHTFVDLLTRLLYNAVSGRRVMITLIDHALHIVCMYAASLLVSLFSPKLGYHGALFLRYGAMVSTAVLFYPALSKTLLVDGFPRFYSQRPLFTPAEWLIDAAFGLMVGLASLLLPAWWMAVLTTVLLMVGYFLLGNRLLPGRPVLTLSKMSVLLLLLPCFLLIFRL
jgi:hypothetical protein